VTSHDSHVLDSAIAAGRHRRWHIAAAVALILLGLIAIVEPAVAGLTVTVLFGWLLVVGGITHALDAFNEPDVWRIVMRVAIALLYGAGGTYFLVRPLLGLSALTLLLAIIFAVEAGLRLNLYVRTRGERDAGWMLVNTAVTVVVAAMIWVHWPSSSIWALGTLVGVNLLSAGASRLTVALVTGQRVDPALI
jgi:uncharacterized membrane protein HdeD (DUF308 family)